MQRIVYSVIFYLALPLILLRLLYRSLRIPQYRQRWAERLALSQPAASFDVAKPCIWIHAVSVGETVASIPLVEELQRLYPQTQILMTTMTPTGSDRVRSLFGDRVFHSYCPYDLPGACNRFLKNYQPTMLILMETELWPNLVHSCHRHGVSLLLANARLSEKSAAGYARFGGFTRSLLSKIDKIAAQAQPDADRFLQLGAEISQVEVTGSLKFSVDVPEQEESDYFHNLAALARPVLVAASTREGEEAKVLRAFKTCLEREPTLLLILIPRHPDRFAKIVKLSKEGGFSTAKRSDGAEIATGVQVLIGDSMGEMFNYYSLATIAFVGGSLVDTGCQNVIEPAALGIPILVGPSQYNFATICRQLENVGALRTVQSENELAMQVVELLGDEASRTKMGDSGKQLVKDNQNALPALVKLIQPLIQTAE